MSWQVGVGVLVLFALLAVYVVFKPGPDVKLFEDEVKRAQAARKTMEQVLSEKAEREKEQVHDEVQAIKASLDPADRQRRAIELLAKLRGVH